MAFNSVVNIELAGEVAALFEGVCNGTDTSVFGLGFGERTHIASLLSQKGSVLYIARDIIAARSILSQLRSLMGRGVFLLPAKADVLTFSRAVSNEAEFERIETLFNIAVGNARAVVTTPDALAQRYPNPQILKENILRFRKGQSFDLPQLAHSLVMAGFRREALVAAAGQFSLRGDILDIFPINLDKPVRLSFFGDLLESIKSFDPETQASLKALEAIDICPSTTLFLSKAMAKRCVGDMRRDYNGKLDATYDTRIRSILNEIEQRIEQSRDISLSFIEPFIADMVSITDYFKDEFIVYDDAKQIFDAVNALYSEHLQRVKHLIGVGEVLPRFANALIEKGRIFQSESTKLAFHSLTSQNNIFSPKAVFSFQSVAPPRYGHDLQALSEDIKRWILGGYRVFLACGTEQRLKDIRAIIEDYTDFVPQYIAQSLDNGFIYHQSKVVVLGASELGFKKAKRLSVKSKVDIFSEIKIGDYIVHLVHGVGRFEGVVRSGANARDYFKIIYAGGDILYVPTENMDSLSKYNTGEQAPKLNKLGGAEFSRVVSRARASIRKLAFDLAQLYAKQRLAKPSWVEFDDSLLKMFEDSFPYEETADQLAAIEDIKNDFRAGKRLDRLICGDVGYGKTEVALRAAFMAMMTGQQVMLLAPTTILAQQHYNTARARLEQFGLRVECLSRFRQPSEVTAILSGLKEGKINLICGTHRLLSKDVAFADLGLMILDEEQRFGVNDKERIRVIKNNVNVITLTATPIPRTLSMSLSGIRDISVINTPPEERIPPQVYVSEYSEALVYDAVTRELSRGGQCFIVYNRVEKIDAFAHRLRTLFPSVNIIVAHGQMPAKQLEKAIADFYEGRGEVLLCSTIIENGIDFPRANTMVVCDSDRFGLSTLYQLRGRVGRSNRLAYVYFTFNQDKILTENAYKRLEVITEFTEFGSGFKIAMRDLEIRGAGNVLGAEQHGHMGKIGYELYYRLLNEEIKRAKEGTSEDAQLETVVHTDFEAFVPKAYIEDEQARIRLFKMISSLSSPSERDSLLAQLKEIYGQVPMPVLNLTLIGLLKNLAAQINAREVFFKRKECELRFLSLRDIPQDVLTRVGSMFGCALRLDSKTGIRFEGALSPQNLTAFLFSQAK